MYRSISCHPASDSQFLRFLGGFFAFCATLRVFYLGAKMSKGLFEDFVLRKKAWRKAQARLPMAEKARIVNALRERSTVFRKVRAYRKQAHS
jgi:hypothetical protein